MKKVRYASSGKKNQITIVACGSATGQPTPPFVIFYAKQLNPLWTRDEVGGTRYGLSKKGWIDRELFHGWLVEHFLKHAVASCPLLLLLDGHSSHYEPATIRLQKRMISFCVSLHTQLMKLSHSTAACLGLSKFTGDRLFMTSIRRTLEKLLVS